MCTQSLGIFTEDEEVLAFQQQVPVGGDVAFVGSSLPGSIDLEHMADGRVVVWTDGAGRCNQDARFRRAGAGIFYAKASCKNVAFALGGRDQTNQRAELLAATMVLRQEQRPVEIRTDSEYVFKGARSWRQWCGAGWQGDHQDLWAELASQLQQRAHGSVLFTKVVGHATAQQVRRGVVERIDCEGNNAADALATRAADSHAAPRELVLRADLRLEQAVATHKMMLGILARRHAAEVQMGLVGAALQEESDDEEMPLGGAAAATSDAAGAAADVTTSGAATGNAAAGAAGDADAAMNAASGIVSQILGIPCPSVGAEPG